MESGEIHLSSTKKGVPVKHAMKKLIENYEKINERFRVPTTIRLRPVATRSSE